MDGKNIVRIIKLRWLRHVIRIHNIIMPKSVQDGQIQPAKRKY